MSAAASAGAVLRYGNFGFVVVVLPSRPVARRELSQAGAWLLLDPQALGLCTTPTHRPAAQSEAAT